MKNSVAIVTENKASANCLRIWCTQHMVSRPCSLLDMLFPGEFLTEFHTEEFERVDPLLSSFITLYVFGG